MSLAGTWCRYLVPGTWYLVLPSGNLKQARNVTNVRMSGNWDPDHNKPINTL